LRLEKRRRVTVGEGYPESRGITRDQRANFDERRFSFSRGGKTTEESYAWREEKEIYVKLDAFGLGSRRKSFNYQSVTYVLEASTWLYRSAKKAEHKVFPAVFYMIIIALSVYAFSGSMDQTGHLSWFQNSPPEEDFCSQPAAPPANDRLFRQTPFGFNTLATPKLLTKR